MLIALCLAIPPLWLASVVGGWAMRRYYQSQGIEP